MKYDGKYIVVLISRLQIAIHVFGIDYMMILLWQWGNISQDQRYWIL